MNTANKLTVFRVLLIPVFLLFFFWDIPMHYFWALVVFAVASITDTIDGWIARRYNLVTDFGKFLDPLADKVLVSSAMICLVAVGAQHAVALVIILAREFFVNGIRMIAAGKGKVVAAGVWGKLKTTVQMLAVCASLALLAFCESGTACAISQWIFWATAAVTLASGIAYAVQLKEYMNFRE